MTTTSYSWLHAGGMPVLESNMNVMPVGDELDRRRGLIERGFMEALITKRATVALPWRFGAPFWRFARRSTRLPLRRLPSQQFLCFNSLPCGPVGEAGGRSVRAAFLRRILHLTRTLCVAAGGGCRLISGSCGDANGCAAFVFVAGRVWNAPPIFSFPTCMPKTRIAPEKA
jgi:hypothetical protein